MTAEGGWEDPLVARHGPPWARDLNRRLSALETVAGRLMDKLGALGGVLGTIQREVHTMTEQGTTVLAEVAALTDAVTSATGIITGTVVPVLNDLAAKVSAGVGLSADELASVQTELSGAVAHLQSAGQAAVDAAAAADPGFTPGG